MKRPKNTVSEVKDYLRMLRYEREYIQDLISQAEEINVFIEGVGSALVSADCVSSSSADRDEKRVKGLCELDGVRAELLEKIDEYGRKRAEATRIIMSIPDAFEKRALLLYYFPRTIKSKSEGLFRSWDDVADEMHCDVRTAQNYHGKALETFAKLRAAKQ